MFLGNNYNNDLNGNNNLNNNGRFVGITQTIPRHIQMQTYNNLWEDLCSYENLKLAFKKARKHKTLKPYIVEFEKNLKENLLQLRTKLLLNSYRPKPLKSFILRDPKIRKISKADFRDRVVHHVICNIIEPILSKAFIYDSYANRIGKGVLKALQRFDYFKRKVTKNNTKKAFVLKADIKHYFETVDHNILLKIIKKKIKDPKVIWLIKQIFENYYSKKENKGMPLGNLTSQFFANAYLNELDQYIKHKLKIKYYIRYVDDFVILDTNKLRLEKYKILINKFLLKNLKLKLHHDKSKIKILSKGICFLGFRNFYYHKLLKKTNIHQMKKRLLKFKIKFENNKISYNEIYASTEGWIAYARNGNTYNLRIKFIKKFEELFPNQIADIEINRWLKFIT